MKNVKYETVSLYCPNCGHRIVGLRGEDGSLKITCDRCRVSIFSKPKNVREINIRITNPVIPSFVYQ